MKIMVYNPLKFYIINYQSNLLTAGWVTITQIKHKTVEVFHTDASLTHKVCSTGKSRGRFGFDPAFPLDRVNACSISHYCDDGPIQMLNTQETLQYSVKDSEHFIPKECSIPRENRPPFDTSKIVKVCNKSGIKMRGHKCLKVLCPLQ